MAIRTAPKFVALAAAIIAVPAVATLAAGASTPQELQKARHEHYHELGDAFKVIRDQLKSNMLDPAALQKAAQVVSDASVNQGRWFPKGTGPEAGKTRALAEIWTKPDDFNAAQKMFSDAAPALLTAAKASDMEGVKNAVGQLGKACKNCHDSFRSKEDHD